MSPKNIPLPQRKALCGKLLVFDALLAHEIDIDSAGATKKAKQFAEDLIKQFDREAETDSERLEEYRTGTPRVPLAPLDKSISEVIKSFRVLMPALKLEKPVLTLTLLPTIEAKATGICCASCTPFGRICEGLSEADDDEVVFAAGRCISQFREMFDVARDAAFAYYAKYGSLFVSGIRPEVVLSTSYFPIRDDTKNRRVEAVTAHSGETGHPFR